MRETYIVLFEGGGLDSPSRTPGRCDKPKVPGSGPG